MRTNDFNRVLAFIGLVLLAITASAGTLTGRVVGIADGDTLTILDANRRSDFEAMKVSYLG